MANERGSSSPGKSGLTEQIKQDGRQRIESTKQTAADRMDGVAQALDSARARLDENQPTLAAYAGQIATGVSNLATRLREGSVEELLEDTRSLARRNPALFLAGGVAVGFVLARFLKASAERASQDYVEEPDSLRDEGTLAYASGSERIHSAGAASQDPTQDLEPGSRGSESYGGTPESGDPRSNGG